MEQWVFIFSLGLGPANKPKMHMVMKITGSDVLKNIRHIILIAVKPTKETGVMIIISLFLKLLCKYFPVLSFFA